MSEDANPIYTALVGASQYEHSLDQVIEKAQREIRVFDQTLGSAFNSARRAEMLRRFFLSSRRNRMRIVVHDPAHLDRNCPRLLALLRAFSYAISIHETRPEAKLIYDPFAVADQSHFVHRFHFEGMHGMLALDDPIGAQTLIERYEEIWEASSPAVSATTLGL